MKSFKHLFPKNELHYFDSSTKPFPFKQSYDLIVNFDYHNGIFSSARQQASFTIKLKEELAQFLIGKPENLYFTSSREISWNLVLTQLSKNFTEIVLPWSEDTALFTPAIKNFKIKIAESLVDIEHSLVLGSSIDPLTGLKRDYKLKENQILLLDTTYDISTTSIEEYKADIIIADLSIGFLSPFTISMIYIINEEILLDNPFPTIGNVSSFTENEIVMRDDNSKFEIGVIDYSILQYFQSSLAMIKSIGKVNIQQHNREIAHTIFEMFNDLKEFNIVSTPFGQGQPLNHLSISSNFSSHDIALLLDEISNIQVRSGRICAHLAMEKLNLTDVIRISWNLHIDENDLNQLRKGINQIISMLNS